MPPSKRRRTAAAAATSAAGQGTLSFRTSKSSVAQQTKGVDTKPSKDSKIQVQDKEAIKPEVEEIAPPEAEENKAQDVTPEEHVEEKKAQEVEADEEDEAEAELNRTALALPETKIKVYWANKERERKAPRVHQESLTTRQKVLREFDMSSRYGPSIGINRLKRWHRAHDLGMNPPIEVLAVLLKETGNSKKGSKAEVERSIMDELIMSSRDAAVEA